MFYTELIGAEQGEAAVDELNQCISGAAAAKYIHLHGYMTKCSYSTTDFNAEKAEIVEAEYADWLAAHAEVSEHEVHADPDATWLIQPGMVWRNCAARLRFTPDTVEGRLDRITARFRETQRGAGFWVSQFATPSDLSSRLKARGYRCQKHFPTMYCDLRTMPEPREKAPKLAFQHMNDESLFQIYPHPYLGKITTDMRRFELKRLTYLTAAQPARIFNLLAFQDAEPVGACTLFLSKNVVGFHDVGVISKARRRGTGAALMRYACQFAREKGATGAVLTASGDGYGMYLNVGFHDVGRVAHWYRQYHDAPTG